MPGSRAGRRLGFGGRRRHLGTLAREARSHATLAHGGWRGRDTTLGGGSWGRGHGLGRLAVRFAGAGVPLLVGVTDAIPTPVATLRGLGATVTGAQLGVGALGGVALIITARADPGLLSFAGSRLATGSPAVRLEPTHRRAGRRDLSRRPTRSADGAHRLIARHGSLGAARQYMEASREQENGDDGRDTSAHGSFSLKDNNALTQGAPPTPGQAGAYRAKRLHLSARGPSPLAAWPTTRPGARRQRRGPAPTRRLPAGSSGTCRGPAPRTAPAW
jgi:hypothetical protein